MLGGNIDLVETKDEEIPRKVKKPQKYLTNLVTNFMKGK